MTLDDLKKKGQSNDSDDDDQSFYAGGEKSYTCIVWFLLFISVVEWL
jgi:hypothetical protein